MKKATILAACALALGLSAALVAAKPGVLKLKDDGLTAQLTFDDGRKIVVTSAGTKIAAGNYKVKEVVISKKDEKGRVWEIRTVPEVAQKTKGKDKGESLGEKPKLGSLDVLMVDEEQEKIINPGPPLVLKAIGRQNEKDASEVAITLTVHGQYNEIYHPGAFLGGKNPPAPKWKAVAEDGKTVGTGVFEVLKEGLCRATWKPGAFKGGYTVEVESEFGPFEHKTMHTEKLYFVK